MACFAYLLGALEAIELELLGRRFDDPRAILENSGWQADAPLSYCRRCGSSRAAHDGRATLKARVDEGCARCRNEPGSEDQVAGDELSKGRARRRAAPRQPTLGDGVVRLGEYRPPLSEWIVGIKHRRWIEMAWELGHQLGHQLGRQLEPNTREDRRPAVVVPAPMSTLRRWERGIDHAMAIAEGLASVIGAPVLRLLSSRSGPTQVSRRSRRLRSRAAGQVRLCRTWTRRMTPEQDDFGLRAFLEGRHRWDRHGLSGHRIVLVDDVRTTGSTLKACCRALRSLCPARIDVAVVAVADGRT